MINSTQQNPRKKQRSVWIEDKTWEMMKSIKKPHQSISAYMRKLIVKAWEGYPLEEKEDNFN